MSATAQRPRPATAKARLTAAQVKEALRGHHPGVTTGSMVGEWTCIEEWLGIDLLALSAWHGAAVVGYEVKVSRADLRRELLAPWKRERAVASTTEFYFAVPAGLLTADELAWQEPEWQPGDFERAECPGVPEFGPVWRNGAGYTGKTYAGRCERPYGHKGQGSLLRVPAPPTVLVPPEDYDEAHAARWVAAWPGAFERSEYVPCPTCGGKGYMERSRAEREAPKLWVPRDVGLVTINGNGVTVLKPSPVRENPEPIALDRRHLNDLVRWVSHRPDPRHR